MSVENAETLDYQQQIVDLNFKLARSLEIAKVRADAFDLLAEGADYDRLLEFFGHRLLELAECDQVVFTDLEGNDRLWNAQGQTVDFARLCESCPMHLPTADYYASGTFSIEDCDAEGDCDGVPAECPVKSAMTRRIHCHGSLAGLLSIHYIAHRVTFTPEIRDAFELVCDLLGLALDRRRDEEERAQHIAQIERERDRALAAEKARSLFFSTVSHDIRTPLNAIVGYAELLKAEQPTAAERKEALDAILTSSRTLLVLINDVLDLSKLEAGKMEIRTEPTDVAALVSGVVDACRITLSKKPVELIAGIKSQPKLIVDPQRLRQILFNLIGNSVKFTDRGKIEVTADYQDSHLTLVVRDTGCGIPEANLARIMEPFEQVGTRKVAGSGLGLAIVKQLLTRMDGSIEFGSRVGVGTVVKVRLNNVREAVLESHDPTVLKRRLSDVRSEGVRPKRILIVDDSPVNLAVMKGMLKLLGHTDVVTAANGLEALEAIAGTEKPFDCVLTDVWMPEMDGTEFVKALRASPEMRDLPVMAVTADVEERLAGKESGFTDVLLKPITLAKMIGAVGDARPNVI